MQNIFHAEPPKRFAGCTNGVSQFFYGCRSFSLDILFRELFPEVQRKRHGNDDLRCIRRQILLPEVPDSCFAEFQKRLIFETKSRPTQQPEQIAVHGKDCLPRVQGIQKDASAPLYVPPPQKDHRCGQNCRKQQPEEDVYKEPNQVTDALVISVETTLDAAASIVVSCVVFVGGSVESATSTSPTLVLS